MTKKHVAYRCARSAFFVGCLLATTTIANAQSVNSYVSVVPPPPAGFDPLKASPQALEKYAFPPAPDPAVAPEAYRRWERAVSAPQIRTAPVMTPSNVYHGPAKNVGPLVAAEAEHGNIVATATDNWSGSVVFDHGNKPFANGGGVMAEFIVPDAMAPSGSIASLWAGLDGFTFNGQGSGDVLQAGVDVRVENYGGPNVTRALVWTEWYPNPSIYHEDVPVSPGDVIWVNVWTVAPSKGSGITQGYALIYNETTKHSAKYKISAPKKTSLVGDTAEWVIERPSVNNKNVNLANYVDAAWTFGMAWNNAPTSTYYYPGQAPTGTLLQVEMLDDKGNEISRADILNDWFLNFIKMGQ